MTSCGTKLESIAEGVNQRTASSWRKRENKDKYSTLRQRRKTLKRCNRVSLQNWKKQSYDDSRGETEEGKYEPPGVGIGMSILNIRKKDEKESRSRDG